MSYISYAQNFEDVLLMRCFKDVSNGFYIDLGAHQPEIDSVTKLFYDRGWSGINIEPTKSAFDSLVAQRPRDLNLQLAVGERAGWLNIWEFNETGLSTGVEKFAEVHIGAGLSPSMLTVEMMTLGAVCKQWAKNPIHFIKIDVEGFEAQVLAGADFKNFRPMVIVIESTEPNSQVENFEEWEYLLFENQYLHCYSDGLNRFYLATEATELLKHFQYPPNVFDDFILSSGKHINNEELYLQRRLNESLSNDLKASLLQKDREQSEALAQLRGDFERQALEALQEQTEALAQKDREQNEALAQLRDDFERQALEALQEFQTSLNLILNSKSWKFTQPLRSMSHKYRKLLKRD